MKSRAIRQIVSVFLTVGFIAWGAIYLYQHSEDLVALTNISIGSLMLLIGLAIVKIAATGMFTWINLGALGIRLGFWEWYGLSAMTAMGNYLIAFRGGAAIRGVYLKSKYSFPYTLFISTVATLYLLTFPTNAILGLLALLGVYLQLGLLQPTLIIFLGVCVVVPLGFLAIVHRLPELPGRWANQVELVINGWRALTNRPATIIYLVLASIFNSATTVMMVHVAFQTLGVQLPIAQSGILGILYLTSAMIPITPAGMGFSEAALVLASQGFGLASSVNILAAGLNRTVMVAVSLLLGPILTILLTRQSARPISLFSLKETAPESGRAGE